MTRRDPPTADDIPRGGSTWLPPAVDYILDDDDDIPKRRCPVKNCDAFGYGYDEPDCDHEYPGKCVACDKVVGDRHTDLVWMGRKLGVEQWLCERCRGFCEECDGEDKITLDGVCGDCCRVYTADGTVLHEGKHPTLELLLIKKPRWHRIEES